jgi:hypothetical protein
MGRPPVRAVRGQSRGGLPGRADRSPEGKVRGALASTLWVGALLGALSVGCAGNQRRSGVAPETRQRSEEMFGRQQRSMDSFNQTPSEQAGERHEYDRPARPPEEGNGREP